MHGDVKIAEKELRRLFTPLHARSKPKGPIANPAVISGAGGMLKVVPVKIYASDSFALLDSGAVPNLISSKFVEQLNLVRKSTSKPITFLDGSNSTCMGRVCSVPITLGTLTIQLDFRLVKDAPLGTIIELLELTRMKAVLHLEICT